MIKAKIIPRGGNLNGVYPKVVFNPEAPTELLLAYNITDITNAPINHSLIAEPILSGWGTKDRHLVASGAASSYLFDWNAAVASTSAYWATFTGSLGNGTGMYLGTLSNIEIIPMSNEDIGFVPLGTAATSTGAEVFMVVKSFVGVE